jgi:uracil-DNA glycosylase family 4
VSSPRADSTTRDEAARLDELAGTICACRACKRLVAWRELAESRRPPGLPLPAGGYWAKPLPGFGDPRAKLALVGLAPAAHGGNRTGRMFTGDRSGDFLYAALYRAGYANQAESVASDDGLRLTGAYVTAAVRCAPPDNRPAPAERDACAPFLAAELSLLSSARVFLALGQFAYEALFRVESLVGEPRPRRPKFTHGLEVPVEGGRTIVCSYHPSQRNVFTGLLTAAMFDAVLARVAALGA